MNKIVNALLVLMIICMVAAVLLLTVSALLEFSSGNIVRGIGYLGTSCTHMVLLIYFTACYLLEKIKNRGR